MQIGAVAKKSGENKGIEGEERKWKELWQRKGKRNRKKQEKDKYKKKVSISSVAKTFRTHLVHKKRRGKCGQQEMEKCLMFG